MICGTLIAYWIALRMLMSLRAGLSMFMPTQT